MRLKLLSVAFSIKGICVEFYPLSDFFFIIKFQFQEMIQQGLEGNEIVTLLQWVGIYK